ncbi:hypothetical protein AGMMS49992_25650 [Clostridia bacterium]|nr:hypothetical protein AGMMS49992_25650 [Clostridia bacterium]
MRKTHTSSAVKQRYNEKAYDRLGVTIPKGCKSLVEQAASAAGESVNAFTNHALLDKIGLQEWPKRGTTHDEGE